MTVRTDVCADSGQITVSISAGDSYDTNECLYHNVRQGTLMFSTFLTEYFGLSIQRKPIGTREFCGLPHFIFRGLS